MWYMSHYCLSNKNQNVNRSSLKDKCKNFVVEHGRTVCYLTTERDECTCGGNREKCDFYMKGRS